MFPCRAFLALCAALIMGCQASGGRDSDTASQPWQVSSGLVTALIQPAPWKMQFFDADGELLLSEHGGTGLGPTGSLGFHLGAPPEGDGLVPLLTPIVMGQPSTPPARELGWAHATEATSLAYDGETLVAKVATTASGVELTVRIAPQQDGSVKVTAEPSPATGIQAFGIGFEAGPDEQFYGFGQRGNAVGQRGNDLEHYVGEGPYQDEEYPGIIAAVPKWGIRWRRDATYFPMPWLLSTQGYGVLLDQDALSYHRLGSDDPAAWSMEVEQARLAFRVFADATPAAIVGRLSASLGRQPDSLPDYIYGPWVQPDVDERIDETNAADVPTSVAERSLHYLPCGDHVGQEQAQIDRVAAMHARGAAITTYFNPMICANFQPNFGEAEAAGALQRDRFGQTYLFPYTTSTVFVVGQFDFTAESAPAEFAKLTDLALSHGYDGWMEDFGEYTPLDAVAIGDGATGTELHNRYPREYHCGVSEAVADKGRLIRFVRSGWTGSARCSPTVWGGDPTTSFGFDGLESSIYQALSMGLSGVGIWSSDVGGFFALGFNAVTDELLQRWIAFGAFSGLMRTRVDGIAIPDKPRPQLWEPANLATWRQYAKLRTQLFPYIKRTAQQYYATGLPMMRHHLLTHPDDAEAIARDDQFMFGDDFLVAPVYIEGADSRELYLPPGRWLNFWQATTYDDASGAFDLAAQPDIIEGGQIITAAAPPDEIPLFVRAGTRLELLAPDVDTLTEYGSAPEIVHASDRAGQERVLQFPH